MKVAIMQPYLFPYIGYFQLIHAVDTFVIYDNIKYTKKGWINRNRILVNGHDEYFSVPIKKDSDALHVNQRVLAETFKEDKIKLLARIKESYRSAPHFSTVLPLIETVMESGKTNLFDFIFFALQSVCHYLDIKTPIVVSSTIDINHQLKGQDKVLAIAKSLGATNYINAIGGIELYSKEDFSNQGITLQFINSKEITYRQFNSNFIPWLSIIDLMMFNSKEKVRDFLSEVTYQ